MALSRDTQLEAALNDLEGVLHELRKLQALGERDQAARHTSLAITSLEQARHWLEDALRDLIP